MCERKRVLVNVCERESLSVCVRKRVLCEGALTCVRVKEREGESMYVCMCV